MKNIKTVFLKELKRFFTDPRMLIALFLPGILIFIVYSIMGDIMKSALTGNNVTEMTYNIAYTDNSGSERPAIISFFDAYMASSENEKTNEVKYTPIPLADAEKTKDNLVGEGYDVLIVFSNNFETAVYTPKDPAKPNHIDVYYDGASEKASNAYQIITAGISSCYNNYYVNVDKDFKPIEANVSESDFMAGKVMGFIFPMVTVSLLFSTVMSTCPDAVAGEKERGTLAAMLLTPIKRSELALGKILALAVVSAASGIVSFLGLAGSIPKLMGGLDFNFSGTTIVLLAFLVLTTLFLFVTIGLTISSVAKTTKEATSYIGPMMMILMLTAILPAILDTSSIGFAFIPFLNMASCMADILAGGVSVPFFLITIGMNVAVSGLLIYLITRIFNNERLMVS